MRGGNYPADGRLWHRLCMYFCSMKDSVVSRIIHRFNSIDLFACSVTYCVGVSFIEAHSYAPLY